MTRTETLLLFIAAGLGIVACVYWRRTKPRLPKLPGGSTAAATVAAESTPAHIAAGKGGGDATAAEPGAAADSVINGILLS